MGLNSELVNANILGHKLVVDVTMVVVPQSAHTCRIVNFCCDKSRYNNTLYNLSFNGIGTRHHSFCLIGQSGLICSRVKKFHALFKFTRYVQKCMRVNIRCTQISI